jgi:hypothetical protein
MIGKIFWSLLVTIFWFSLLGIYILLCLLIKYPLHISGFWGNVFLCAISTIVGIWLMWECRLYPFFAWITALMKIWEKK